MNLPFEYDQVAVGEFGGTTPTAADFANARVVILPIPLDRTTSYLAGTRHGPHEIRFDGRNLGDQRDPISESELGDAQYYRMTARRFDVTFGIRF